LNQYDTLPIWQLSDLYPAPDSPEITSDMTRAETDARAFNARYESRIGECSAPDLAQALVAYTGIEEILGRLGSYAYLRHAADGSSMETSRFLQDTMEKATDISTHLVFFSLEINRIPDDRMNALLADPVLARHKPWLEEVRTFRKHQLSDDMEKRLHERQIVGGAAWSRLFDETMADLRFTLEGKDVALSELLNAMTSPERDIRKAAAEELGRVLTGNVRLFALITNTLAKDKEIDDRWRGFAHPAASRHLANQVEDGVVDALVSAVKDAYPRLSHRYYALKAKWMGVDRLDDWDRNAPLPESEERTIPWEDCKTIVLSAYHDFSPRMADIAGQFFSKGWIDAAPRPGKQSGAFAHPTVPSVHPYILTNYHGKTRDVMTVAHEVGHGIHQTLSAPQGILLASAPLTFAEVASVFGEMLTFRKLLSMETDPLRRKHLIAGKVEDMLNTVVRQIAFHEFECRLHNQRKQGELLPDDIATIWMDVQKESLGPALAFHDHYRHFWAYIPHFIHSPFYVYAYAFADCMVNALYATHESGMPDFAEKYIHLLEAGGSKRHRELLAPFGLDASDPAFWNRGLAMIEGFITELEGMA